MIYAGMVYFKYYQSWIRYIDIINLSCIIFRLEVTRIGYLKTEERAFLKVISKGSYSKYFWTYETQLLYYNYKMSR